MIKIGAKYDVFFAGKVFRGVAESVSHLGVIFKNESTELYIPNDLLESSVEVEEIIAD